MPIDRCRVCGNKFFAKPLLRYARMPKSAQFLPDKDSLKSDKGVSLEVRQCRACGLVQLSNEPVPYYKQVIRASGFSEEMKSFRRKQFAGFVKRYSLKNKKIIEIGCGRGEYLSLISRFSLKAYGLEYSRNSAAQCVKSGLRVVKGFIEHKDYKLAHGPFEAFFILNFLEHLPDANSMLRGIYSNLTDAGVGLVEVPNFDMILRKNLFAEFISDHLFYFTKETLKTALKLNGFEIIECKEIWHDYIISAVVRPVRGKAPKFSNGARKRRRLDLAHFYKQQARLKDEIDGYIRRFQDKRVAVWGAGHQALTIISLANLSGKIKYVVDSATFKQNKFTPATHIAIVSPEALEQDPVDAVIVMAASYSDEVAGFLRKKFGKKIDVSILRDFGLERA
jgi:cyclopropane fatty-acyl-phospholipid synthase-like methyltransferase